MNRRDFISTSITAGVGMWASTSVMPSLINVAQAQVGTAVKKSTSNGLFVSSIIGLGGAPLGNGSDIAISDEEAHVVLENAWKAGYRYYDTSPFYGFTKSERRFGRMLAEKKREDYVLSTKIGRIFTAQAKPRKSSWVNPSPFDYKYDYSAAATRRSIEDSLQRLGVSSLDMVFIHDLSPDNADMKDKWTEYFEQALKGAMPELSKMRAEGLIKGWGMGVNTLPPMLRCIEESDPNIGLQACNYTLIDHEEALAKLFPLCEKKGVSLVIGSPLNNGFLAGRDRFNYAGTRKPTSQQLAKRSKLTEICRKHNVDLRTAALQFCAAPKVVTSVIPGARRANQPQENFESMKVKISAEVWSEMKKQKLIAENAPIPS